MNPLPTGKLKQKILVHEKKCTECKLLKPINEFNKHFRNADNHNSICRSCCKNIKKIVAHLKKIAITKPSTCECCGIENKKLQLDHDHLDNSFRGWLCGKCNRGLGYLGDTIDSLNKAKKYLIMSEERKNKNEHLGYRPLDQLD